MTKKEIFKIMILNKRNRNCNDLLAFLTFIREEHIESESHDYKLESRIK